ncbi:MAG: MFS transporter [Porphyromonas sp.]|nr:MFS transporter [Porphyromonas sp.]
MSTVTQGMSKTLRDNGAVRWGMLLMIALTMLFAYMFVDVLSPLQAHMGEEFGWSGSVFGTYAGSEFFINVFLLFLIFAGIILDKMGVRFTAVLSGSLMVVGAFIKVYALSKTFNSGGFGYSFLSSFAPDFPASAKMASVGFAIFGTGCEMAGVTVSRAIVKWFEGKEMALAMAIEMAIARLGVAVVMHSSPAIHAKFGSVQAPVLFGALLLTIGLLLYLVYGIFDGKLDRQLKALHVESDAGSDEEPFHFRDLRKVFGSRVFWIITLLCMLYYAAIFPFQRFATNMLESNLGFDNKTAAGIFSLFPFGAMIITPPLGYFLDRKGKGATMLMVGSILMILCHGTFALYPFGSDKVSVVIAITAIVLLGISFSLVPAALWPSLPKLIDNKVLGSAYSATFFIQNIGLMLVPMLIGSVLDLTNPGVEAGEPLNYTPVMLIFTSFGVAALLLSALLKVIDKRHNYGLELPNIQ